MVISPPSLPIPSLVVSPKSFINLLKRQKSHLQIRPRCGVCVVSVSFGQHRRHVDAAAAVVIRGGMDG